MFRSFGWVEHDTSDFSTSFLKMFCRWVYHRLRFSGSRYPPLFFYWGTTRNMTFKKMSPSIRNYRVFDRWLGGRNFTGSRQGRHRNATLITPNVMQVPLQCRWHESVTLISSFLIMITRICAAEMAVRYAALSACRKVHVCHCNSLGGATTLDNGTDGQTDRQTECDAICGPLLGRRAA